MGDVVIAPIVTRLDTPPDRVLTQALAANLDGVVTVGWTKDGDLYFASSYASGPESLWLLALAQKQLLEIGDPSDD